MLYSTHFCDRTHTQAELIIMTPLHHENLVRLHGGCWNEGADKLCIVLEYCQNGSLDSFLTNGAGVGLAWATGLSGLALDAAKGLRYLHHELNEPLIHRDIKPDNIMVSADVVAKLADFGESKHFDMRRAKKESQGGAAIDVLSMTQVGK